MEVFLNSLGPVINYRGGGGGGGGRAGGNEKLDAKFCRLPLEDNTIILDSSPGANIKISCESLYERFT
jgi:hypothetical protein